MPIPKSAVAAILLSAGILQAADPAQSVLEAQRRWIDSYNHRNENALLSCESDDFRITFGDGTVQGRADQVARLRAPLPLGAEYGIAVESNEVRVYGNDAAVVTGIVVERGKAPTGRPFRQRSRYTDTWVFRDGRWQVVASHLSQLKEPGNP